MKEKKAAIPAAVVDTIPVPPPPPLKLSDIDKMALDLAKERKLTALAEAKTAMANNEKAELTFRYTILQIYYKYGLKDTDTIQEDGSIVIGGALQQ